MSTQGFTAGLPFPVPEILEFKASDGRGKFSCDFPGVILGNPLLAQIDYLAILALWLVLKFTRQSA